MSGLRPLSMIAAMDEDRVIGALNKIPWHHPEDLKHFKRLTLGHALIMGRATYESIGKPLPKRHTIIVTRNLDYAAAGCQVAHSLEQALEFAYELDNEPVIAGGGQLYAEAMPRATLLHLTQVPGQHDGDAYFPAFDESEFLEVARREEGGLVYRSLARR